MIHVKHTCMACTHKGIFMTVLNSLNALYWVDFVTCNTYFCALKSKNHSTCTSMHTCYAEKINVWQKQNKFMEIYTNL